jgi:hypothetical protein
LQWRYQWRQPHALDDRSPSFGKGFLGTSERRNHGVLLDKFRCQPLDFPAIVRR